MPCFDTSQQLFLMVDTPNGSERPAETRGDGFENARCGAGQAGSLGQHSGNGILRSKPRLFEFSLRYVSGKAVDPILFRTCNGRPQQPSVAAVLRSIAIFKSQSGASACERRSFGGRGGAIIGMNKVE